MFKIGSGKKLPTSPQPPTPALPDQPQRPMDRQPCGLRFHVPPVNYGRFEDYTRETYATGL